MTNAHRRSRARAEPSEASVDTDVTSESLSWGRPWSGESSPTPARCFAYARAESLADADKEGLVPCGGVVSRGSGKKFGLGLGGYDRSRSTGKGTVLAETAAKGEVEKGRGARCGSRGLGSRTASASASAEGFQRQRQESKRQSQGEGERQEEQVNLALDLGARSNPLSLAAFGWRLLAIFKTGDSSLARFTELAEKFAHTIQRGGTKALVDLLPFPFIYATIAEMERADHTPFQCETEASEFIPCHLCFELGAAAWLQVVILALNFTYLAEGRIAFVAGEESLGSVLSGSWSVSQRAAKYLLVQDIDRFLHQPGAVVGTNDWRTFVASRVLTYGGDSVAKAVPLTWAQIKGRLPPPHLCGHVSALSLADGAMRDYLAHPEREVEKLKAMTVRPKPGRVHTVCGEWAQIGRGLLEHNVLVALEAHELIYVDGLPLVNGAFGIEKPAKLGAEFGSAAGLAVHRFIMNLTASNTGMDPVYGDIDLLPYVFQRLCLYLKEGTMTLLSTDDVISMFYIFSLGRKWAACFAFDDPLPGHALGFADSKPRWLASTVVPMGWKGAVGLCQYLFRQWLLKASQFLPALPASLEIRKDMILPRLFSIAGDQQGLGTWLAYIDGLDVDEFVSAAEAVQLTDPEHLESPVWQEHFRAVAREGKVPLSSAKADVRRLQAKRLGLHFDGFSLCLHPGGDRIGALLDFTEYTWRMGTGVTASGLKLRLSHKWFQVLGGNWICNMQLRRPIMGVLHEFWKGLHKWTASSNCSLPVAAFDELALCMALAPLMYGWLARPFSGTFTVSDACETGGGVCASSTLAQQGVEMLSLLRRQPCLTGLDVVGILELFGGIGGGRRACELAGLSVAACASVENAEFAMAVTRQAWPGTFELTDVRSDAAPLVTFFRERGPRLKFLLIIVGSPCSDVSALNAGGAGIGGARSSLLTEVPRIRDQLKAGLPWVTVHTLGENVASMLDQSHDNLSTFNQVFGTAPVFCCAETLSGQMRPRLYWPSWHFKGGSDAALGPTSVGRSLWLPALRTPASQLESSGISRADGGPLRDLCTAVRCTPRRCQPAKPAGLERCDEATLRRYCEHNWCYPPYQFKLHYLVCDNKKGRVSSPRPLCSWEREWLLGFMVGHTACCWARSRRSASPKAWEAARCALLGNAFSCLVVGCFVMDFAHAMGLREQEPCATELLSRMGPLLPHGQKGKTQRLAEANGQNDDAQELCAELFRRASHRGTEVRLGVRLSGPPSIWPLSPIPAALFVWKVVLAFPLDEAHINVQEMRAVLSSFRWRLRRKEELGMRCLHLVDSQVSMLALAKGRSSSSCLTYVLRRINALVLAGGLQPAFGYVRTDDNPADRPSRWRH